MTKLVELCKHNLSTDVLRQAAADLKTLLEGKAEVKEVSCIGDCRACHNGVLIARVNGKILTGADNQEVIYLIEKAASVACGCCQ